MRLELDVGALLEVYVADDDFGALLQTQQVHHPDRDVTHVLLRDELEIAAVCFETHLWIGYHERHRVTRMDPGKFMQRRLWHYDCKQTDSESLQDTYSYCHVPAQASE